MSPNFQGHGHEPPRKPDDSAAHGIRDQLTFIREGVEAVRDELQTLRRDMNEHLDRMYIGKQGEPAWQVRLDRLEQFKTESVDSGKSRDKKIWAIIGLLVSGFVSWILAIVSGHVKLLP